MAILSSIDIKKGVVRLKFSRDTYPTLIDFLTSIAPDITKQKL